MTFLYDLFIYPLLHTGFFILSFFNKKVKQGFAVRSGKSWIKPIPPDSTWVWFHVASGELEYAKPVIRLLKSNKDFKSKIIVTFFSPSVISSLAKTSEVDLFVPMPWDTPWNWREFLNHYKPRVLAISRTDTWPNLVWQSHIKKIPSLLFSATLPRQSGRVSSFFGRLFYASIFENLTSISCVSEEDKNNFLLLSQDLPVSVDGDTRFDQAISRVGEMRELPSWTSTLSGPVFVAGSTWPEDEKELLPALASVYKSKPLISIIAPHEPTESHLSHLEKAFAGVGLKTERYSRVTESYVPQIILVDKVGILADLYRLGQVAFVGGSFKKSVHSVMEPAASGCFTFFGPFHHNNREALALKAQGLAQEVHRSNDIKILLEKYFAMNSSEIENRKSGILQAVQANRGVSNKIAQWIMTNS